MPIIKQPNIPKWIEQIISFAEKKIGHKMLPARLLLWIPKAFMSSMILEGLIAHKQGKVNPRLLKLIRMQVSLLIACPFCIDMNSSKYKQYAITSKEIKGLQGQIALNKISSFNQKERITLYFTRGLVRTPIKQNPKVIKAMTRLFNEKEFATIVTTIAQVAYWTRVIQGFGIPPAGFLEQCILPYEERRD